MSEFDVVVLGAGPAGEVVAGRCAGGGLSVAIVESRLVGGECSFYGCIPSKTLIHPGDALAAARRSPGAAEAVTGGVDSAAALAYRDYMTSKLDDASQLGWLEEKGITLVRGHGRLDGPRTVVVDPPGGTVPVTLTARRAVVLATGTSPAVPPIPGLADAAPWDNRNATSTGEIPQTLLVLGGGAIGLELAQAFKRLGSHGVTVLEGGPRLLGKEEPFAGEEVHAALTAEGIEVRLGAKVESVGRDASGRVVATLSDATTATGHEILVAVGRRPNTADLGLSSVRVEPGRYLSVDRRFRVAGVDGGWLYAVGDCNGLALLTHMGKYQARIAGDVIRGLEVEDVADHGIVSRVTFTDPQVAAVGLTEGEARAQGIPVRTVSTPTGGVAGASTQGRGITGTSHIVVDSARRVIVGATFTGPGIAELLHSATIAVAGAVTLDTLWHAVPAFPTVSEVWLNLLEAYGL